MNAHIGEDRDDTGAVFRRYSRFLPPTPATPKEVVRLLLWIDVQKTMRGNGTILPVDPRLYPRGVVAKVRDSLQEIWSAEDADTAEWRLLQFRSRMLAATTGSSKSEPPSPEDPLAQALAYLRKQIGKLKKCANPQCPTPFFIADRKERKYCGEDDCTAMVPEVTISRPGGDLREMHHGDKQKRRNGRVSWKRSSK